MNGLEKRRSVAESAFTTGFTKYHKVRSLFFFKAAYFLFSRNYAVFPDVLHEAQLSSVGGLVIRGEPRRSPGPLQAKPIVFDLAGLDVILIIQNQINLPVGKADR